MKKQKHVKCDICDLRVRTGKRYFNPRMKRLNAEVTQRKYNPDFKPEFEELEDGKVEFNVCLDCYDKMGLYDKRCVAVDEIAKDAKWDLSKMLFSFLFMVAMIIYFLINWIFLDDRTSRELAGVALTLLLGGLALGQLWSIFRYYDDFPNHAKSVLLMYNIFALILFYYSDISILTFLILHIVCTFLGLMRIGEDVFIKIKRLYNGPK